MKKLLKKEVCGSRKQCMRPIGVTHSCEIFVGQRGSGSRAQCTGPTDSTVSHVKRGSQFKKKGEKKKNKKANANAAWRNAIQAHIKLN